MDIVQDAIVLVVDSDLRARQVVADCLERAGFGIATAASAEEALELVSRETPTVIISEAELPGIDGFAFARRLKDNPAWSYIPFVLLTRERSEQRRFRGLELGITHYLTKPLFVQDLLLRVRALAAKAKEDRLLLGQLWRARGLQEGLVGPKDVIKHGPLTIAGTFAPAGLCGGDFWNHFEVSPQTALVLIADVSGHGVPSALIAAAIRACCDTIGLVAPERLSVATVMRTLNRVCCRMARQKLYVTCFVSLFDFRRSTMTYASAGHPMPFIFRGAGADEKATAITLASASAGNVLGEDPSFPYQECALEVQPGDLFVWYTDGLVEARNRAGQPWRDGGLLRAVKANLALGPEQMREAVLQQALDYYDGAPPEDDITLVIGRLA